MFAECWCFFFFWHPICKSIVAWYLSCIYCLLFHRLKGYAGPSLVRQQPFETDMDMLFYTSSCWCFFLQRAHVGVYNHMDELLPLISSDHEILHELIRFQAWPRVEKQLLKSVMTCALHICIFFEVSCPILQRYVTTSSSFKGTARTRSSMATLGDVASSGMWLNG